MGIKFPLDIFRLSSMIISVRLLQDTRLSKLQMSHSSKTTNRECAGNGCKNYQVMAFIIPFLAMTLAGAFCKDSCVATAPTIGLLAGATGFGLYRSIKFILRSVRLALAFNYEQGQIAETWQ